MFAFPQKTAFGKIIPKSRIYAHAEPSRRVRELFTSQVAEIRWAHKLSRETLNLPETAGVPEIEIFEIRLKTPTLDDAVLEAIDRAIPYPIVHRLRSEQGVAHSAAFKRPSEVDSSQWVVGSRFTSEFRPPPEDLPALPTVLDLGHLYGALMAGLMPLPARKREPLGDQVARCERFRILKRQVDQLTSRIRRERQFNRKVAFNQELKPLKAELEALSAP
ncbi:methyl-accepting chemotaxis protein [Haloferula helveola]|uniref:Methyl-accepting chemotaxis protein n=1 Tax=Haloferula helveola TaxID=490095 RepID=A0ABM7RJT9_9BACT|nr:methyl-accepting chemotaxis protein [Haloferula helveola]